MTNEYAGYILRNTACLGTDKDRAETEQAVEMAVKALRVADALELIRAEIEELQIYYLYNQSAGSLLDKNEVLNVIDKYRED